MGKVYQSVRGMVQGTLTRRKPDEVSVQPSESAGLDDAMDTLEKGIVSGLARLKMSVRSDQTLAASKLEQAEQVIAGLRARVAGLEVQLRETHDAAQKKDAAAQEMEERLGSEIRDLHTALKEKQEVLENRDGEISNLKTIADALAKQVTDLEAAIQQAKEAAATDARLAEQVIEDLRGKLAGLGTQLSGARETLQKKQAASQEMEERLGAEIRELQESVKQKDEVLQHRDSEINDLKSQADGLRNQVSDLETAVQQTKEAAAGAADRAGQAILELGAKAAGLEAQLKTAEETVRRKEADSQKMEESLAAEIRELQESVKQKDEVLQHRDSEINDLKSQADGLRNQVSALESAIEHAKEAAEHEARRAGQVIHDLRVEIATLQARVRQKEHVFDVDSIKGLRRKQARPELAAELETPTNGTRQMPSSSGEAEAPQEFQAENFHATETTDDAPATVSRDALERLIAEFSECANVIRSMASLIMRHHVKSLGEAMEEFPRTRLPELVESLAGEIPDAKVKAGFLKRFGKA